MRKYAFLTQKFAKISIFQIRRRLPAIRKLYTSHFPATHLTLDRWQSLCNFSSEILATTLLIIVAGFTLFSFTFQSAQSGFHDNSLAFMLLKNHTKQNDKLYARSSSIKTIVSSANNGFLVPEARADSSTDALVNSAADGRQPVSDILGEQDFMQQDTVGGMATMIRPNPDSIAGLVQKQIKIHTVARTDTLYTLSKQYGISVKTIQQANNLAHIEIKEGWQLLILPTDGIVVKADSNTTLPDIANKYHGSQNADQILEKIIAYNGLADAEDIDAGQFVICPAQAGCDMPAPPPGRKPKPGSPRTPSSRVQVGEDFDGHAFPYGYCTWYVSRKRQVTWGGNAKNWLANARAQGYDTGSKPAIGAIVATTENRRYGHVAVVEKVFDDGSFEVSEMNFEGFGKIDYRTISDGSNVIRGFIY